MQIPASENPYVGPRSIEAGEAFYGRDREIRTLSSLLIAERIVLLHSPSGAGKSSLIQAGIAPRLNGRFHILPVIRVNQDAPNEIKNTPSFNRYLFSTLLSLEEQVPAGGLISPSQYTSFSLDGYLKKRSRPEGAPANSLMFFDQFEEILTTSPTDQEIKLAFFKQLGDALQDPTRWALFSIREDYMGGLAPFVREISNRLSVTFRLDLLSPEAARKSIQEPAKRKGGNFTDSAAKSLIADLRSIKVQQLDGNFKIEQGPSIEPVQLQVICFNLWQAKATEDKIVIDDADLVGMGNVDQALAGYYSSSIERVCKAYESEEKLDERYVRRWFDKNLITAEGIRSQVLRGTARTEGLPNEILSLLENSHLIRTETRAGKTWYELSHDRLVEPIKKDNFIWYDQNLKLFQRQAEVWDEQRRSENLLLRGKELVTANQEAQALILTDIEQKYLEACNSQFKQEQRKQRQNRLLRFLALGVTLILLVAIYLWQMAQLADEKYQQKASENATTVVESRNLVVTNAALATQGAKNAALAVTNQQSAQDSAQRANDKKIAAQATASWAAGARVEQLYSQAMASIKEKGKYRLSLLLGVEAYNILKDYQQLEKKPTLLSDILDISSPDLSYTIGNEASTSVLFSPDGSKLAISNGFDEVTFWDVNDPTQPLKTKTLNTGPVTTMLFSADGRLIAFANGNSLSVWNVEMGQEVANINNIKKSDGYLLKIPRVAYQSFTFTPEGSRLAITNGTSIEFLGITSGGFEYLKTANKLHRTLANFSGEYEANNIKVIAYFHPPSDDPGRQTLISYGDDYKLRVWGASDIQSVFNQLSEKTLDEPVKQIEFSRDGDVMVLVGNSGNLLLYDARKPTDLYNTAAIPETAVRVAFSGDRHYLAVSHQDGTTSIWDIQDLNNPFKQTEKTLEASNQVADFGISYHPSQNILAVGGAQGAVLWDMRNIPPILQSTIRGAERITAITHNPTRNLLVESEFSKAGDKSTLLFWDISKPNLPQKVVSVPVDDRNQITQMVFSPNGDYLGLMDVTGQIIVFDTSQKKPKSLGKLTAISGKSFLALTNDAILFSQGSFGDVWDLHDKKDLQHHPLPSFDKNRRPCKSYADSKYNLQTNLFILEGCDKIEIWDLSDIRRALLLYSIPEQSAVQALSISGNGKWMSTWDVKNDIQLWDISNPRAPLLVLTQPLHTDDNLEPVNGIVLNENGTALFSANSNGNIVIWDVSKPARVTQKLLFNDDRESTLPNSIYLTGDGTSFITTGKTKILIWLVDSTAWLDKTCRVINGTVFSETDWETFFAHEDKEKRFLTCTK